MDYYRVIIEVNKWVVDCVYRAENCKNHFKIVGQNIFKKKKEKKKNDVAADVAQRESSNIKRYASTFGNI